MNEVPIIDMLPARARGWALFGVAVTAWGAPYVTRAYHALRNGGGIRGVWNGIWFGTNQPKADGREKAQETQGH